MAAGAAIAVVRVVAAPSVVRHGVARVPAPSTVAPAPTATALARVPQVPATATATSSPAAPSGDEGVVPWADLPVDAGGEPRPLPSPTWDPSFPACAAEQLGAKAGEQGVAMGQGATGITVSRVSGPPCRLDTTVKRLSAATPGGTREDLPTEALRFRAADHATTGQSFSYVVTLHNATDKEFPLSPCPNYSQTTKLESAAPTDYALNCAAARPIPAGGSEAFAMTIAVPATTQAFASLIWRLHTGGSESILAEAPLALEGPTGGEPRACVASQLSAVLGDVRDRADGFERSSVTIRRVTGESCTLRDDVKLIYGVFDGAEPVVLRTDGQFVQEPAGVALADPGDAATFDIRVRARCDDDGATQPRTSPARPLRLGLNPAGDLAVTAQNDVGGLDYGCLSHDKPISIGPIAKAR